MGGSLQGLHGAIVVVDLCDIAVSVGAQNGPQGGVLLALILDGEPARGKGKSQIVLALINFLALANVLAVSLPVQVLFLLYGK